MAIRWDVDRNKLFHTFGDRLHSMLAMSPYGWAVTQGFRAPAEQDGLYAKGRTAPGEIVTNAKAFQSPHTVTDPLGTEDGVPSALAVDVARLDENGVEHWDYAIHPDGSVEALHPAWTWLWDTVKASPDMHCGVDFASPDPDHVQSLLWLHVKQQLKDDGKW